VTVLVFFATGRFLVTKARFDAVWTFGALDFGYGSGSWKGFEGGRFEGVEKKRKKRKKQNKKQNFQIAKNARIFAKKQPSLVDLVEIHGQKMM